MTRLHASLIFAALFTGALVSACHPAEPGFTAPVGSVCDLQEVRQ